jgi:uncharacterized protein
MRPFSLLIKPTGADCNLNCAYCFYLPKAGLYPDSKRHAMTDDVLRRLISSYFAFSQPAYTIGWQGGEPTMLGIDFFKKVISLEIEHARPGSTIANGLQTNATLLTNEFADFLFHNKFLVGASLDGPTYMHDSFRRTKDDQPTHDKVLEGIRALKRSRVEFNILILVNSANVIHAGEVYRYLRHKEFKFLQFIPCVEFDGSGNPRPVTITGKQWGDFLCEIFDLWYPEDRVTISIRDFDDLLNLIVDNRVTSCVQGSDCCQYLLVEHNGDVYPCDFFVEKELRLGNIMQNSWEEMLNSPRYAEFGAQKKMVNEKCVSCGFLGLCRGDCLKHRLYAGNPPQNRSWLCDGYRAFFEHTDERFEQMARMIRRRRENKK